MAGRSERCQNIFRGPVPNDVRTNLFYFCAKCFETIFFGNFLDISKSDAYLSRRQNDTTTISFI